MSGLRDGTRLMVTGNPTAEEVAAVVAALDRALSDGDVWQPGARSPGWLLAARREAVGGRLVRTRADLLNQRP